MSGLKTLAASITGLLLAAQQSAGMIDLPREFANCTGRASAMMEHAWLMQTDAAREFQDLRAEFLSLLEAVDPARNPALLQWRLEAKVAQASLLSAATFGADPAGAKRARETADALIASCRGLLLKS